MSLGMDEAIEVAREYLREMEQHVGLELVLLRDQTREEPFGWIFCYDSKSSVEMGNFSDSLVGNAPIFVTREDGAVHVTGTAFPVETYIANFTATGDPHRSE